jgi:hypothetical protein
MLKNYKKEQLTKISIGEKSKADKLGKPGEGIQISTGEIERIKGGIFGGDLDEIEIDPSKIYNPRKNTGQFGKIAPLAGEEGGGEKTGFYEDTEADPSASIEGRGIGGGEDIVRNKEEWDALLRDTIIRAEKEGGTNKIEQELTKRLYQKMTETKPVVDWKKELRKIFDKAQKDEEVDVTLPPDKRARAAGYYEPGTRFMDYNKEETLREIVVACDTSGSITKGQTFAFLAEVERLRKLFEYDTLWIVYCSDQIDGIDRLTSNPPKRINIAKYAGGAGNKGGFRHPFWLIRDSQKGLFRYEGRRYKIIPSLVLYMTDGQAEYPQKNELKELGISKYEKKVRWFIITGDPRINRPPFGEWVHLTLNSIKELNIN